MLCVLIEPRRSFAPLVACAASLTLGLSGCGSLHGVRMLSPAGFGMEAVNPALFVEPAMRAEQRQTLQRQIELGRAQAERFYGGITTAPYVVACVTAECDARFGGFGERATAFGDTAIRLSPNGLAAALVAHEWSHAELYRRVGGAWRVNRIPRWFDEGVAVVVADEPRHSPANWQEIERRGMATPALTELVSRSDWTAAVQRYGETRVDDPDNLRLVYSTAGHALRQWLVCAGPAGVLKVLAAVRAGEDFEPAYARVGKTCMR